MSKPLGIFKCQGRHPLSDLAVILEAFLQLVIGLDCMHRKGIVHRDLKPCDVFVTRQRTPRGLVDTTYYSRMLRGLFDDPGFADSRAKCGFAIKIGDFGLARFTQQDGQVSTGKVGTERYMAPEVRSGKRYGTECDLHSLGVMLQDALRALRFWSKTRWRGAQLHCV